MFTTPAISVITPTYNHAHLLPRVWSSLRRQTEQNFQWIVVDDGSTDDTREVIAGFADPRIDYVWQENGGVCAARNRGDREIRAEFVVYLDSDDEFFSGAALAEMLSEIKATRPEIAGVYFTVVGVEKERLSYIEGDRLEFGYADLACEQKAKGEFIVIYRRDALSISPWPPFNGMEMLRHLRIARQRPMLMINKPARLYHQGDDNLTGALSLLWRAQSMVAASAQLISEHRQVWLDCCPCQLGYYSFYRAMYLALSGSAIPMLPDLFRAFRYGKTDIRIKSVLLLISCVFPLQVRKKLFLWYAK
ncbi:MAG: glycosyltransferase family 2 protein [Zoogloeaceae bacterium]|jgi:hypothetical protein|nr:glycosyltransferase family 2 protein [Zoogloeaceae bacterium]